ncbi:hypothetical protein C8A00DRAFT_13996 [Chaetomidium leptoderma]|uniref:Rhodopsin domain-containing protein n=1 Tax=Chaetomidium leptoderma TaxID=669021 RepID=A0AAN6VP30_9PEZI|nr:hypothetical protein C8A00DRAFT_13996 [Chaetomidium leptoderma]
MPSLGPPLSPEQLAQLPHDDRGPMLIGVSWGLAVVAAAFLALRVYCKHITKRRLWWDDWILIASRALIITSNALTTVLVNDFKLGKHNWDMDIYDRVRFYLVISSRATVIITAIVWAKTAFAVTLLRLTTGKTKAFVWFILVSMNIAMGFSAMVLWIQCQPLAKGWITDLPGTFWAPRRRWLILPISAYSAAMDFTLAILPWTFLPNLTLGDKDKIGISIAMSMGVIAGIVAIIKCVYLPGLGVGDSYDDVHLFIWDVTEATVTVVAACIPTLRVLLRDATQRPQSSRLSAIPDLSLISYRDLGVKNPNVAQELGMLPVEEVESGRSTQIGR